MPIRYHRPTGYECPTSVLNHHNSMSSNGKLCSRAVAKSRPAKPIGPKPPPPSPSPQPKPTPVPPTPVPPTPPTPTPTPTPTPKRSSSALLVSCWAQSSTAAQVRPGAPSAQISTFLRRTLPTKTKPAPKKQLHLSPRAAEDFFQLVVRRSIPSGWRRRGKGWARVQMARPNIPAMPRATALVFGIIRWCMAMAVVVLLERHHS